MQTSPGLKNDAYHLLVLNFREKSGSQAVWIMTADGSVAYLDFVWFRFSWRRSLSVSCCFISSLAISLCTWTCWHFFLHRLYFPPLPSPAPSLCSPYFVFLEGLYIVEFLPDSRNRDQGHGDLAFGPRNAQFAVGYIGSYWSSSAILNSVDDEP